MNRNTLKVLLATIALALCPFVSGIAGAEVFSYRLTGQVSQITPAASGSDIEALISIGDTYVMEFTYDNSNEFPRDPAATLAQFFPPLAVQITYSNSYHAEAYSGRILIANDRSGSDSFTAEMVYDDPVTSGPVLSGPEVGNSHLVLLQVELIDGSETAFDSVDLGPLPTAPPLPARTVKTVFHNELGERSVFKATVDTLEVATAAVAFNTSGFVGSWTLIDDSDNSAVFSGTGDQTIELEPGFYLLDIGQNLDYIEVEAGGNVISGNQDAFTGGQKLVTFITGTVVVDPQQYAGPWEVVSVFDEDSVPNPGAQQLTLVLGTNYTIRLANTSAADFFVAVDAMGNVSSFNPGAAVGSGNVLNFNSSEVFIDPGFYQGLWSLPTFLSFDPLIQPGTQNLTLVPGLNYQILIANVSQGYFAFSLASNGEVGSFNTSAASGMGDLLNFNTHLITVDPNNFTGNWEILNVTGETGAASSYLVPGLIYWLKVNGQMEYFAVSDPCAVNPSQITVAGELFNLSCGVPDSDEDGVPDASDNCLLEPNPDQIDQDLDGLGNLCDDDLDGDGIDNTPDNCPDIENAGQEDLDGDDSGDACDDDADGDSVNNVFDNCPATANTDQADNDLDQAGDACDGDDDNDGVPDFADNCPLDDNPDQADFDLNGQGDICDGDVDGDGAANEYDLCGLSPQSSLVNMDGCTGAQFIALICIAADYVQHGQYVSCVAHTANDTVDQGLISSQEKARFVREAAKNK